MLPVFQIFAGGWWAVPRGGRGPGGHVGGGKGSWVRTGIDANRSKPLLVLAALAACCAIAFPLTVTCNMGQRPAGASLILSAPCTTLSSTGAASHEPTRAPSPPPAQAAPWAAASSGCRGSTGTTWWTWPSRWGRVCYLGGGGGGGGGLAATIHRTTRRTWRPALDRAEGLFQPHQCPSTCLVPPHACPFSHTSCRARGSH